EGRPLMRGEVIERPFSTLLVGDFNVANILTALGLGISLGLDLEAMLDSVSRFTGVPGRMERVEAGQPFSVLVDYAHTPDSVLNVLDAARAVSGGRLIGVLGCGGDRDKTKRPHMGRALEAGSDVAIITSDNPRSEEPEDIIRDVLRGLERPQEAIVEPDRMLAIRHAIREAERGDIVLILGKGHEGGQQFRDGTIRFDDRDVARECLAEMYGDAP
ncbi:MAG TPA: cyanophycin synthetase, partial [Thermoleophilia bacterium]|nr:cyanophycin synthetase [Thermoleophilia bacterium]